MPDQNQINTIKAALLQLLAGIIVLQRTEHRNIQATGAATKQAQAVADGNDILSDSLIKQQLNAVLANAAAQPADTAGATAPAVGTVAPTDETVDPTSRGQAAAAPASQPSTDASPGDPGSEAPAGAPADTAGGDQASNGNGDNSADQTSS